MIDLVDNVAEHLREQGYEGVTTRRLDEQTGKEGIVVRRLPYTVTDRYYDRERAMEYVYQVIVRNRSEKVAMQTCSDIADLLYDATVESKNGSYGFISMETYTEPQELELGDPGFYAWECRIAAQIYR